MSNKLRYTRNICLSLTCEKCNGQEEKTDHLIKGRVNNTKVLKNLFGRINGKMSNKNLWSPCFMNILFEKVKLSLKRSVGTNCLLLVFGIFGRLGIKK